MLALCMIWQSRASRGLNSRASVEDLHGVPKALAKVKSSPIPGENRDYMQELRLLAHLSQEPVFLKALNENIDLHTYSASLLYDIPYNNFFELDQYGNPKRDKDGELIFKPNMKVYRTNTKSITFGLLYGMTAWGLSRRLHISYEEAEELIKKYFNTFKKIDEFMRSIVEDLHKNHYALSPLDGRILDFTDLDWDDVKAVGRAERQAKNFPFQGAGASVTKLALIKLYDVIEQNNFDAKILFTVHDEINLIAKEDIADKFKEIVKIEMIEAFNDFANSVPMDVSVSIGDHWVH